MTGVNGIFGNQGVNYTTRLNAANALDKTSNLLFQGKTDGVGDAVKISKTPGNTGVAEATARGTLTYLDELAEVGF